MASSSQRQARSGHQRLELLLVRAPVIGAVIVGWAATHATATKYGTPI
ncbi:hypothetical protein ACIBEJ_02875 [Nonomuraea sp. NPDC050790]